MRRVCRDQKRISRSASFRRTLFRVCALKAFLLTTILQISAQTVPPTESQVKAAYLYNFSKFVRWQTTATSEGSFQICVIGKDPFAGALEATVAGESVDGKSIVARNVTSLQDAARCRMLFISSSEEARVKTILGATRHLSVLTVSDMPGFAERGGMIGFVNEHGRIRFAVNVAPMADAGLAVSSELLKVAVTVIGSNHSAEIDK